MKSSPDGADGQEVAVAVEDVELGVRDGPADDDRAGARIPGRHLVDAAAHHGLRRAVLVDEAGFRGAVAPERQALGEQVLAADDEEACLVRHPRGAELVGEQRQVRRRDLHERAVAPVAHRRHQALPGDVLAQDLDAAAAGERNEEGGHRQVEGDRAVHGDGAARPSGACRSRSPSTGSSRGPRWTTITPLGWPVEPDVYMT